MTHPHVIAMRRRIARIRRLVAACAVAAFLALFSTIYVQMASGHDPGLAATTASTTSATSEPNSTATGSWHSDSEPSAVTTSQS
jgi:hypothetical protein